MAQNLNKTKRRISSINSTKKITNAMELVSTVKLKKFRRIMEENKASSDELFSLVNALFEKRKEDDISFFERSNDSTVDLVIVVSSNLGLCASYNNDIIKFVENNVNKESSVLLTIGTKADDYFKRNNYEIDKNYLSLSDKFSYDEVSSLSKYIISSFRNAHYRSVRLIYTRYVNSIRFEANEIKLLPLDVTSSNKKIEEYPPIFDPSYKTLIDEVVPFYITSLLYQKIVESFVSEHASRRNAMENATDNANELIDELTLEYNKARQTSITQEITEVVSASLNK